jgi:hypothetical protein
MTETVHSDYEVSSEGAVRHWEIPYARLTDATPTPTNPAEVISAVVGSELTGTILTIDATTSFAVIDFTHSMVYRQDVRTVSTYKGGNESAWQALNIGDTVYFDSSAALMALGVYLSVSPLDSAGVASPIFGHIVPAPLGFDTDAASFPLAAGVAGNTHRVAVMQEGA